MWIVYINNLFDIFIVAFGLNICLYLYILRIQHVNISSFTMEESNDKRKTRGYRYERIDDHLQGLLSQLPQQACEHVDLFHHILLILPWD